MRRHHLRLDGVCEDIPQDIRRVFGRSLEPVLSVDNGDSKPRSIAEAPFKITTTLSTTLSVAQTAIQDSL